MAGIDMQCEFIDIIRKCTASIYARIAVDEFIMVCA